MTEPSPVAPTPVTSTTSVSDVSDLTAALNEMNVGEGSDASEVMSVSDARDIVSEYVAKHSAKTSAPEDKDKKGKSDEKEGKGKGKKAKGKDKKVKGTGKAPNGGDEADKTKLAFWQALCIEFGIVQHPSAPRKEKKLPPMPTSITQTRKLLKERAHVNLVDYFEQRALDIEEGKPFEWGQYKHLVFKTEKELVKYTIGKYRDLLKELEKAKKLEKANTSTEVDKEGNTKKAIKDVAGMKIFPKKLAKAEGLQPLMRFILCRVC